VARFEDLVRVQLETAGVDVEPQTLRLGVDLARMLVRSTDTVVHENARKALDEAVAARTDLPPEAREVLLDLALSPRFRTALKAGEVRAFAGYFGREAANLLQEEQSQELDYEGFAGRYGTEGALLLLDALFRIAVADGSLSDVQARDLEQVAADLGIDGILVSALFQRYDARYAAGDLSWTLEGDRVTVGRGAGNDIVLTDPQVARHHCTFVREGQRWRVVDAHSGRPVLVDGVPISATPITQSSRIQIGPWTLQLTGDVLQAFGHRSFTALSVKELSRKIGDITLLEDVSFTVFSGEVVALVGPSGAGKTTLINAISGIAPADSGDVLLDGRDFHGILAADPSAVGLVPQEDLVHPELLVEESLYYSGRLRYPPDVSSEEVHQQVDRVLNELGIGHIRESRIGDAFQRGISGGQRKRVNLGQELLTRSTRVLFLDEPTSGLDPRSAHGIVGQVRQLSDDGRIVFLVSHDLTPGIMALVDHLMVLVPGGRLGFFGTPSEACRFFRVASPDLIFNKLEERSPEQWRDAYKKSHHHRKYVATREHLLGTHKLEEQTEEVARAPWKPARWLQLKTLTARYARAKMRDRTGLAVLLAQPPLLALMVLIVFPVPTFRTMFMLSLSCLWFGMSGSVRELITDRAIWRRERKVGVGVLPYVGSKLLVLGFAIVVQVLAFTALIFFFLDLADYGFNFWALVGVNILTGLAGTTLGLMVSAGYSSSEAAVGTLPLILIPQICFCSVMVPLRHMGALAKAITWITIERFAFDATLKTGEYLGSVGVGDGKWERVPMMGPLYDLGLKSADVMDMGLDLDQLVGALAAFAVAFLVCTLGLVWHRDRPVR